MSTMKRRKETGLYCYDSRCVLGMRECGRVVLGLDPRLRQVIICRPFLCEPVNPGLAFIRHIRVFIELGHPSHG